MHMCDRVEQKGQERQGQDDKTPLAPVPLKRQKKKMPHGPDFLQVFTASRYGTQNKRLQAFRQSACHCGMGVPVAQ